MFKNIILAFVIVLFIGCGQSNPNEEPQWYSNTPKDKEHIYATASAKTQKEAKELAIQNMKDELIYRLDNRLLNQASLVSTSGSSLATMLVNQIPLRDVRVEKTTTFQGDRLILISIKRDRLFNLVSSVFDKDFKNAQSIYMKSKNNMAIKSFIQIKTIILNFKKLKAEISLKHIILPSYKGVFQQELLDKISKSYRDLQSKISIYVLYDKYSKKYQKIFENKLIAEGFSISKKPKTDSSLKVLVTSKDLNNKNFYIRVTTYNLDRQQIGAYETNLIMKSDKDIKRMLENVQILKLIGASK